MNGARGYDVEALNEELRGSGFHGRLHYFPAIDSTNAAALEAAQAGAAAGSVYFADEQTAGRGRGGHEWHSAAGTGLYVSVLLRPTLRPEAALKMALSAGLAAQAAIEECCGERCDIRWPNDLMMDGKKCGGILVETSAASDGESLRHAVAGVGINVNQEEFPDDLRHVATSLRIETGRTQERQRLLAALLRGLEREMETLERGGGEVLRRFEAASTWVRGKRVQVDEGGGYTGRTDGLDAHGFLRVRTESGGERLVLSGGVREIE